MQTEDDQSLLEAEHTSTIVMLVILIGLIFLPDLFGCSSAGAAPDAEVRQTSVTP